MKTIRHSAGFSLVELIVVMVIIAILMAVAIPMYLGHKRKAAAVDVKQQVMLAYNTLRACESGYQGDILQCDRDQIVDLEPALGKKVQRGEAPGGLRFDVDRDQEWDRYAVAIVGWTDTGETNPLREVRFRLDVRDDGSVAKYCRSDNAKLKSQVCPSGKW